MTEEQIRAIVRDEIEAECLKEGGVYDHCRSVAFTVVRSVAEMTAKRLIDLWGEDNGRRVN